MVGANLKRAGNELGAKTTYQLFLEKEAVPTVRGFHVEDINAVELFPWARVGGRGVYLNLDGSEGVDNCYICETRRASRSSGKSTYSSVWFTSSADAGGRRSGRTAGSDKPSNGA